MPSCSVFPSAPVTDPSSFIPFCLSQDICLSVQSFYLVKEANGYLFSRTKGLFRRLTHPYLQYVLSLLYIVIHNQSPTHPSVHDGCGGGPLIMPTRKPSSYYTSVPRPSFLPFLLSINSLLLAKRFSFSILNNYTAVSTIFLCPYDLFFTNIRSFSPTNSTQTGRRYSRLNIDHHQAFNCFSHLFLQVNHLFVFPSEYLKSLVFLSTTIAPTFAFLASS